MNTPGPHEHERLMALLDAYGADLARWPAAERPTPAALTEALGRNHALASAFAEAAALDGMLGAIDAPVADDLHAKRLQQRILAVLPPQQQQQPADPSSRPAPVEADVVGATHGRRARMPTWLRPALAALVPLMIGFDAGFSGGSFVDEPVTTMTAMSAGASTPASQPASTDTQYADETTMAPFLLAANVETMAQEMRQ